MKNLFNTFAFVTILSLTFLTACKSSKSLQTSKTPVEKSKSETAKTTSPEKKTTPVAVNEKKTTPATVTKKTTTTTTTVTETYSPLPPPSVEKIFYTNYPTATQVTWSKQMPLVKVENKDARDYKVFFVLDQDKNTIIYSEKGEVIETRTQILTDQLPQNIYNSIKKQYPDAHIVSASTVKNIKINGSYAVIIKSNAPNSEKELLLTENGTFVE